MGEFKSNYVPICKTKKEKKIGHMERHQGLICIEENQVERHGECDTCRSRRKEPWVRTCRLHWGRIFALQFTVYDILL